MVSSKASTVQEYLASLPEDRRKAISAVRRTVKKNLPRGFQEGMQYGMISWYVPLSRYPDTYNGQPAAVASLASQKQHMALYLMSVYGDAGLARWFQDAYRESGKKLDMGKSCVRFKKLEDLPLDVIGEAVSRVSVDDFIAVQEEAHGAGRKRAAAKKKAPAKRKAAAKKRAATGKKAAKKKAATRKKAPAKRKRA